MYSKIHLRMPRYGACQRFWASKNWAFRGKRKRNRKLNSSFMAHNSWSISNKNAKVIITLQIHDRHFGAFHGTTYLVISTYISLFESFIKLFILLLGFWPISILQKLITRNGFLEFFIWHHISRDSVCIHCLSGILWFKSRNYSYQNVRKANKEQSVIQNFYLKIVLGEVQKCQKMDLKSVKMSEKFSDIFAIFE